MQPECLKYYAHRIETARYAPSHLAAHTMPRPSLREYVVRTKFSGGQVDIIREAVADGIPIEIHGIYLEHLGPVLVDRGFQVVASSARSPRRSKKFNIHRPLVLRVKTCDSEEKIWIVAFPSREYVQQVSELTAAFVDWACEDGRVAYTNMPIAVHYEYCDRYLEEWSGLRAAASQVIRAGDLVVLGYVEEIARYLGAHGYSTKQAIPIDDGKFGEILVTENDSKGQRAVLVGIYHTFWGSAAGRICAGLANAGATDVFYISKAGTLIAEDYVHKLVNPDIYYVFEDGDGRRDNWQRWDVPCRLRSQFPELVAGLGSGVHLTVPSVMSETFGQSVQYCTLRPATIDNEAGYIARELSIYNSGGTRRPVSFVSMHFLTDYLRTEPDVRTGSPKFDLSSVDVEAGSEVRRALGVAIEKASSILLSYLDARTSTPNLPASVVVPYPLPTIGHWFGRGADSSSLEAAILSRSESKNGGALLVFGSAGVGKTRLGSAVCRRFVDSGSFNAVIWVSLRPDPSTGDAPRLETIIERLLLGTVTEMAKAIPPMSSNKFDLLLSRLALEKYLVVLDDVEAVLEIGSSSLSGYFASRHSDYREFFKALVERSGESVVVILSRERIAEFQKPWCLPFKMSGLPVSAAVEFLRALGLGATHQHLETLATRYGGNPKALELVVPIVLGDPAFGGAVDVYLRQHEWLLTSDLNHLLSEVWVRLSADELLTLQRISVYDADLVPLRAPAIVAQTPELPERHLYDVVIQALLRRNILAEGRLPGTYSLDPLIQEKAMISLSESPVDVMRAHRLAYQHLLSLPTKPKAEWRSFNDVATLVSSIKHACAAEEWIAAAEIACDEKLRRGLVSWGAFACILDCYGALSKAPPGIERMASCNLGRFRAIVANMIGIASRNLGRSEEAVAWFRSGLLDADDKWKAIISGNLCLALVDCGRNIEAVDVASQARDLALDVGDRRALSYALGNLGVAYFGLRNLQEAKNALEADLELADGSNIEGEAHARAVLGAIALEEMRSCHALRELKIALLTFRTLRNDYREIEFLPVLGAALSADQAWYSAALCLRRCQILLNAGLSTGGPGQVGKEIERVWSLLDSTERGKLEAMSDAEIDAAVGVIISSD